MNDSPTLDLLPAVARKPVFLPRSGRTMLPSWAECRRLNLAAIAEALRSVQEDFARINARLQSPREPFDEAIISNMLTGYAYLDTALAQRLDFFAMGSHHHLLELNARVLCGTDPAERTHSAKHLALSREHFYNDKGGGIRDIVDWLQLHAGGSPWQTAAGVYVRLLTEPQLFLEGNHRTGALIISYLLARAGEPPFVLTPHNAAAYFDPSACIKNTKKNSFAMLFRIPRVRRRFAELLQETGCRRFLLASHPEPPAACVISTV